MSIEALKQAMQVKAQPPMITSVQPEIYNAELHCTQRRPFTVCKKEYPFRSHWYKRNNCHMHYIDEGEGIPIVLTHGNPDWSFLNRNIIKEMSTKARVIAYDLPGFGFSEQPNHYKFTPQEHADWIESLLLQHLKLDKFILVVQDWGGPTGLHIATRHPEKITGVVIANTWAWRVDGTSLHEFSSIFSDSNMEQRVLNENFFVRNLLLANINAEAKNNQAIQDAYLMAFPNPESRRGTAIFPQQMIKAGSWLDGIENNLDKLKDKHIEFIFGEKDFNSGSPKAIARWRKHFPKADVQLIPNGCHFIQEDSPESFCHALGKILKASQK